MAKIAEVRNLTKEERLQYDVSLKRYRDTLNVMRGAIEEGKQQGLQQGRLEEKKNIAKQLLALNLPIASIAQATGLTEEEIKNVKD